MRRLELARSGERFWNTLAGDLFVIGQFTGAIISQLNNEPLPDGASLQRPKLLSLRRIREIDRQMSPAPVKSGPKRQQRPSQV